MLPSLRAAIRWVCARLAIVPPDLDDKRFEAVMSKVVAERAKTLKEAVPIPIGVMKALEVWLVRDTSEPVQGKIFIWWMLCSIFASLRFDDAIHVTPSDLVMKEEGLSGVCWQTKVDRKRVGTRFIVPKIGFAESSWLEYGWDLFSKDGLPDRDYWVPELNARDEFKRESPTHSRSLQWLKYIARKAVDSCALLENDEKVSCARKVNTFTLHSCRVTLLDAAVHARRSTEEIGLQANWKNPGPMVLKYTRNRSSVPAQMVKSLVQGLVQEYQPESADDEAILFNAGDSDLAVDEFFIKQPAPGSYYEYKFHCISDQDNEYTACNKFLISECSSVGSTLPGVSVLCKACARCKPDLLAQFS